MQLFKHLTANNINLNPLPFQRELSMQAYLIENSDVLILDNDNLSEVEIIEDELSLKGGRKSKDTDGRIDILALYNQNTIGIIELKLGELNDIHLRQLEDYLEERNQIVQRYEKLIDQDSNEEIKWIGVLVGLSINGNLQSKISDGYLIHDIIPIAALTIRRYRGEDNQIYVLTDTYFKNISRNFDRTQYSFNNNKYGKGRLVLAVIKKYIEDNPNITYSELEKTFPKNIQGSTGVISTFEEAEEIYNRTKSKRHFIKSNELIRLNDNSTVAISSQWGILNIGNFLNEAKDLGYKVIEI